MEYFCIMIVFKVALILGSFSIPYYNHIVYSNRGAVNIQNLNSFTEDNYNMEIAPPFGSVLLQFDELVTSSLN